MDHTPTVSSLFLRYQQRLMLNWIAGEAGAQRPLTHPKTSKGSDLIGYLNVIHPNQLQVLGKVEYNYLNELDELARATFLKQLFALQPTAIFIGDTLCAPDDLRQAAKTANTALIGSQIPTAKLINSLRYYLGSELAEKTTIHGVFLEVNGLGILLTGESNMGKSELALELITRNHRLIADDAPEFSHVGPDTIRGSCPEVLRDFLEVRGLGILNIRAMFGDNAIKMSKDLRLIVNLKRMAADDIRLVDRLKGSYRTRAILDIEIPEVTLPVVSGRNLAVLVEAAARDHILLRKGYNASEDFIKRQNALIQQDSNS